MSPVARCGGTDIRPRRLIGSEASVLVIGLAVLVMAVSVSTLLFPAVAFGSVSGSDGPDGSVTVGATDGGSSAGTPGSSPGTGGVPGGGSVGAWTCTSLALTLNDGPGIAPGGPTPGGWYSITCTNGITGASTTATEWITDQSVPSEPTINPRAVALQAENSLRLPGPSLRFDPAGTSVVNLATWLWVDPTIWYPHSVTAAVGSVQATAVATPVSVVWTMGDGGAVTCLGPGVAFDVDEPSTDQATGCSYRYSESSVGQLTPDGNPDHAAFTVRATVHWSVSWTASGAPGGGSLPSLTTTSAAALRVEQVESVNSDLLAQVLTGGLIANEGR